MEVSLKSLSPYWEVGCVMDGSQGEPHGNTGVVDLSLLAPESSAQGCRQQGLRWTELGENQRCQGLWSDTECQKVISGLSSSWLQAGVLASKSKAAQTVV